MSEFARNGDRARNGFVRGQREMAVEPEIAIAEAVVIKAALDTLNLRQGRVAKDLREFCREFCQGNLAELERDLADFWHGDLTELTLEVCGIDPQEARAALGVGGKPG